MKNSIITLVIALVFMSVRLNSDLVDWTYHESSERAYCGVPCFTFTGSYLDFYESESSASYAFYFLDHWLYNKAGWIYTNFRYPSYYNENDKVSVGTNIGVWAYVYGRGWQYFYGNKKMELTYTNRYLLGDYNEFSHTWPRIDYIDLLEGYELSEEFSPFNVWTGESGWVVTTEDYYPYAWSYSRLTWVEL